MSCVYVVGSGRKVVKIGYTAGDPVNVRLKGLLTGSPDKLRVLSAWAHPYAYQLEHKVHRALRDKRVRREWFAVSPADAAATIVAVAEATGVPVTEMDLRPAPKARAWPPEPEPEPPKPPPYVRPRNLQSGTKEAYLHEVTAWIIEREKRIDAALGKGAYKAMPRTRRDIWAEKGMRDWQRPKPPLGFLA